MSGCRVAQRGREVGRIHACVLVTLLAGFLLLLLGTAAQAQAEAVNGTIRDQDDQPLESVEMVVRDSSGNEVGRTTTDADGQWRVELPGPGEYEIELLVETLPEGVSLRESARNPITLEIRAGGERAVLFSMGEAAVGQGFWPRFLNRSVSGIKVGLIIAMASVGLSLIFGTTKLINFAHGELVSLGAITAWFLNVSAGLHLVVAALVAVAISMAVGGFLEAGIWRRLRARGVRGFQFLVLTIGLSLLAQSLLRIWFGSDFKRYADYAFMRESDFGPISVSIRDLIVMLLSTAVLVAVAIMLKRSRIGKAMRATSDNRDLAEASGIDVNRITVVVWGLGAGLAALGGIFLGILINVQYLMGFQLLLLMFAAVILGGLGTAFGAMVGGLMVGYISEVSTLWLLPDLKTVWALVVLVLVLLLRPQGILGVRERFG